MSEQGEMANIRSVLHEFGFSDGVVNASDEDAERIAAEVVRLRTAIEQAEMDDMRRKYLHYGHGPQEGGTDGD